MKPGFEEARIKRLLFFLLLLFLIILLRLAYLQIFKHEFYKERSIEQRQRIIILATDRGDIFDRQGRVLATSKDVYSIFLVPSKIKDKAKAARELSEILKEDEAWILKKMQSPKPFVFLKRKAEKAVTAAVEAKKINGVGFLKEKKRVYPKGHLASQLLGFVGLDNQGLSGIELSLDHYLKGEAGQMVVEGDPGGRELLTTGTPILKEIQPPTEGLEVTLTIDEYLQYIAEQEIERQIKQYKASCGMLILMDAKTGEILALASKPDFDPNNYKKSPPRLWHPRFLDPYEPGSTFKVISVAAGLEEGAVDLDTKLKALDSIEVGGKIIKNSHPVKWLGSTISISRMLEESINTGAVQIGLKLGPEKFCKHIKNLGFGEPTRLELAGESWGIVRHWKNWYKSDLGMIAFGQSIAVTPLQLISALSAFANAGETVQPRVIKMVKSPDGRFVKVFEGKKRKALSPDTAQKVTRLMENVVLNGSGRRARMQDFRIAGKTGTAQKAVLGGRGYMEGHYVASFMGLAPCSKPRLLALVIVDDPKGSIWGELVAGPVFKSVVEEALRYLNIPPDKTTVSSSEAS